ncbi:nicotinate phosphoribosyltransferase [Rhizina undulata]
MRKFYDEQGIIKEKSIIVFSDSLDVQLCKTYKAIADKADFEISFGVGTENIGKSTGDPETVKKVKKELGYIKGRLGGS